MVLPSIVAPYTGAWIEMEYITIKLIKKPVAPYTGAWIEIINEVLSAYLNRRTLHGCVD